MPKRPPPKEKGEIFFKKIPKIRIAVVTPIHQHNLQKTPPQFQTQLCLVQLECETMPVQVQVAAAAAKEAN